MQCPVRVVTILTINCFQFHTNIYSFHLQFTQKTTAAFDKQWQIPCNKDSLINFKPVNKEIEQHLKHLTGNIKGVARRVIKKIYISY